jgi:sulfatase modifying factor 1
LDKATALDRVVEKNPPYRGGDNFPMTYVSAYDAKQFVKFLNVFIPQQGWEWALPSEEQWEYACRAGSKKAFWNSDKLSSAQANFENNTSSQGSRKAGYLGAPCKVASFAPNGWKIFDMHGNVSEWCSDYVWHQETVKGTSSFLGYAINSYRGGSWNDQASSCRSAFRSSRDRYVGRSSAIGFRVALVPSE